MKKKSKKEPQLKTAGIGALAVRVSAALTWLKNGPIRGQIQARGYKSLHWHKSELISLPVLLVSTPLWSSALCEALASRKTFLELHN
jgi:hypothetical protein